ncbi:MAG: helix-turn-helix transcriptional regulator [Clostridia bacterium]|nr:helix-turn-helix transcriptional regulator [Clostridia bacterium]
MNVTAVRHAYPEQAGFCIDRRNGYVGEYTFLHFHNSVEMKENGEMVMTHPHAVIIYEPNVPQYFKSYEPLIHDWMHFEGDSEELLSLGLPLNTVCYPGNPSVITELTAQIESEYFDNRPNKERMMEWKAGELFLKVGRGLAEPSEDTESRELLEKLRRLRGQMFMSLGEEWTVGRMADNVFLSESRFYAVYKKCFGISPRADLIAARMNSAKNRLVFGKDRVEDIAEQLGYQNTTHFIRQFKDHIGTTPTRYRKDNG